MAKKRRQNKKKHGDVKETTGEFMSNIPESENSDWTEKTRVHQEMSSEELSFEPHTEDEAEEIVDPIGEQIQNVNPSIEEVTQELESSDFNQDEESIGIFLTQLREAKGISLKNISQSTKISLTNLEFLESDHLEALPDRAYVIGYVKSYARALAADQKKALLLLEQTYQSLGAIPREQEIVIPQAQKAATNSLPELPYKQIAAGLVAFIALIGLIAFFVNRSPSKETKLPQAEVSIETQENNSNSQEIKPQTLNEQTPLQSKVENTPSDESAEEQKEVIVEKAQPKEEPIVSPKSVEKKPIVKEELEEPIAEAPEEVKEEEEDKPKEKKKFYPFAGVLYAPDNEMSEERQSELLPSRFKVSPDADNQNIFITAVSGDSWLTYKSDNKPIKKFVLKKGRSLLIRAQEARIFLGNLSAVKIFLNNLPLEVTSQTGVKSLVFPQSSSKKYMTPLFIYKKNGTVQTSEDYIKENP